MKSDDSTTSSSSSSSLDVPYALDLSLDNQSSGLEFESPDRQRGREPLRVGDVIAYTCPVFTAGATYGRREATVVSVDPTHEHFPLVLDNCESLPWDTFVQRIGEFYKGRVRQHPGRQRPISRFVLKASGQTTNNVLAATLRQRATRFKTVLQNMETEAVRMYAGRTNNEKSKAKLGLFPTVPRHRSTESQNNHTFSGTSRGKKSRGTSNSGKRPLPDDSSTSSSHEIRNNNNNTGEPNLKATVYTGPSKKRPDPKSPQAFLCHVNQLDYTDSDSLSDTPSCAAFRTQSPSTWLAHTKKESRMDETRKTGSDSDSDTESNDSFLCSQKIPFYVRPKSPSKMQPAQAEALLSRPILSFTKQNNHKAKAETAHQVPSTLWNNEAALAKQSVDHTVSQTIVKPTLKGHNSTLRAGATSSAQTDDTNKALYWHNHTKRRRYSQEENFIANKLESLLDSDSDDSALAGKGNNFSNTNTTSFSVGQFSSKPTCPKDNKASAMTIPVGRSGAGQSHQDSIFDFHSDISEDTNQVRKRSFEGSRKRKDQGLDRDQYTSRRVYPTVQAPLTFDSSKGTRKLLPHFSKDIENDSDSDSELFDFRSRRKKKKTMRAQSLRNLKRQDCKSYNAVTSLNPFQSELSKRHLPVASMPPTGLERHTKQTIETACSMSLQKKSTRMVFQRSPPIKPTWQASHRD